MNREIKFRAWDLDNNTMIYYPKWSTLHRKSVLYFSEKNDTYVDESDNNNNVVLMQFTGLQDTNNKDIYEGDILEDYTYDDHIFHKVDFFEGTFSLENEFNERAGWVCERNQSCVVIGNIYQHPELLD